MEYSGFLFDSLRGPMLCLDEKLVLLLSLTDDMAFTDLSWSLLDLDRVKGSLLHYSAAISHLRIRVAEMQRLMGPISEDRYDTAAPLPAGLTELAVEMRDIINRFGPAGSPLWPPVASSAYRALLSLLSGEERSMFCALTWDASPFGWAGLAR